MTLQEQYEYALEELAELGELFLEYFVEGKDTTQIVIAIGQVTRETRKLEKKIRKENKKSGDKR